MRKLQTLFLMLVVTTIPALSQKIVLDGYAFEELNRGFLNEVKVTILDVTGIYIGEVMSDMNGHFVYDGIDSGKEYVVQYEKKIFKTVRDTISTVGKKAGDKIFLKQQMERQPGYLLEVTLAEKRNSYEIPVDAINGCRIEVFNVTQNKEELVIDSAKSPVFSVTLQQGNQYTVMIRKKGFFVKRMDANVNINGCYLCMDGFGTVNPGVTSNLTSAKDNKLGTLLSNIELERIDVNRNIVIQNIYYASASADLTTEAQKELDKVVSLMKNNPSLIIELGSHTDSRGSEESNLKLSQARAQSAVNYITNASGGWIDGSRIKAKGYGESRLTNKCEDGTPCSDAEHIRNRRTELKIIGFTKDPYEGKSLAEIIHEEQIMKFAMSDESDKQYRADGSVVASTQTKPAVNTKDVSKKEIPSSVKTAPQVPKKADTSTETKVESAIKSVEQAEKPVAKSDLSKENVKVSLNTVEKDFTGYKIELFTSKNELSAEDPDLKMIALDIMSNIDFDKLKNDQVSYMVGTFLNWSETERFLAKVQPRYPKAQIVDYFKGKRVGQ
ncbi:MAG: OmpA family protein [Saprospiraceae bacterium]|nr:OmpA family protein [Saprospiraceae bacterium]